MHTSESLLPGQLEPGVAPSGLRTKPPTLRKHVLSLLILVVAVCCFRWPLLSGRSSFLDVGPDWAYMAIPDFEFRAQMLHQGKVPLWNMYQSAGLPYLAEFGPGELNPFSYLLLAMPLRNGHLPVSAIIGYWVLLECFAAIAAYLLLADLGCGSMASILGGMFYAIGGLPGNTIWIEFLTETIYPPLVFLFLFRSLRGRRPILNAAIAGAIGGVSWFSGSHHMPLITALCGFFILAVFAAGKDWKRGLVRLLVFGFVMVCISAPQILPAVEFSSQSLRWVGLAMPVQGARRMPFEAHLVNALEPSHFLDVITPLNFSFWGAGMTFVGVVALAFVPFGVRYLARTRLLYLLLSLILAGTLLCVPGFNNLYGLTYLFVPGFDKLRESIIWFFAAHLAITCLFGIGLERFFNGFELHLSRWLTWILACFGGILVILAYVLGFLVKPEELPMVDRLTMSGIVALLVALIFILSRRALAGAVFCAACIMATLMIEHGNVSGHSTLNFLPRDAESAKRFTQPVRDHDELAAFLKTRPDLERIDASQDDVPEKLGETHGIEEMSGRDQLMLDPVFEINYWTSKAKQLYGVNYYLAKTPSQPDQREVFTAGSGIKVFFTPNARPRTWAVHTIYPTSNWDQARALMQNASFDLARATFLATSDGPIPALQNCDSSADQVRLLERTAYTVRIQANMGCKGMVILNDNFYPGWRGTVDGANTTTLRPYMTVRGVIVEAGHHIIEMHFYPWAFYGGLVLFLLGLGVIVLFWQARERPSLDLLS